MRCPNCGSEMEQGVVESRREIMWKKSGRYKVSFCQRVA